LHYLDDLDSKMGAARAVLSVESSEDIWTAFSPALGRRLLRVDLFRKGEAAADADAPSQGELSLGHEADSIKKAG
jgi:hypothetical protein